MLPKEGLVVKVLPGLSHSFWVSRTVTTLQSADKSVARNVCLAREGRRQEQELLHLRNAFVIDLVSSALGCYVWQYPIGSYRTEEECLWLEGKAASVNRQG